ncbi:LMBR1 domain-containing protein 2 homolog isoform X1 [Daktulosphaira vitifoliae]|uniref:LMBR1 domain-containing protein 2 homolog isoform X1 n=1 Tax=Daktulosphaira vitifoliae TaxID=58002 RepID=UPI0021AACC74|nr:LMBR1 domain-containing protein 2 homolog isoform X1 [Daktulosphaira vitifoliae]
MNTLFSKMTVGIFTTEVVFAFILTIVLLNRYGNWKTQNVVVTIAVLISWYFSLLIIFVLPIDISLATYRKCIKDYASQNSTNSSQNEYCKNPWSYVPSSTLPNLWRVVYWTSQLLTWFIMPVMQYYVKSGEFTLKEKLKNAIKSNTVYYSTLLTIVTVLLIYIALKPGVHLDWQKLKAIASSASNTWGLFLLILLLGIALVDIPTELWRSSQIEYRLRKVYFKLSKLNTEKLESEGALEDVIESIKNVSLNINPNDQLYDCFQIILKKVPEDYYESISNLRSNPRRTQMTTSIGLLTKLHKQLITAVHMYQRTETQGNITLENAIFLEDINSNMSSRDYRFVKTSNKLSKWKNYFNTSKIEWYWWCRIHPTLLRTLAVFTGVLSAIIVWSEITFFSKKPVLSIFALMVEAAQLSNDYVMIQVLSTISIAYLAYCTYSTIFKIKLLNIYYLAPNHQTTESSLIFFGLLLSRLTAPLCLNFLGVIHMDSHVIRSRILETDYTQIMGHMDVITIISDGFNIYFPILILVICMATYFKIGSRILSMLGFPQFLEDDELLADYIQEGRLLVIREKERRDRKLRGNLMRQKYRDQTHLTRNNGDVENRVPPSRQENMKSYLLDNAEPIDRSYQSYSSHSINETEKQLPNVSTRPSNNWEPPRNIFDDM